MIMKTRISLLFQVRKSKIQSGKAPVYLKVTVDNDYFELSTKQWIDPTKWNAAGQKVSGTTEEIRAINSYLMNMAKEVYVAHDLLLREEKEITGLSLKNRLLCIWMAFIRDEKMDLRVIVEINLWRQV